MIGDYRRSSGTTSEDVEPADALIVGDSATYVGAAIKVGIPTLPCPQCRREKCADLKS